MKAVLVSAFLLSAVSAFGQSSYTWTAGTPYSASVQVDEYRHLETVHTQGGIVGAVLMGGMTVNGRLYGQSVVIENGGHGQLDFEAADCYLQLADGTKIPAMGALDLEKWEKHEKRKQFWKDAADAGADQLNAHTAAQVGVNNYGQVQMLAQGADHRDAGDVALLSSLDNINGRSLMAAGLQPGEDASGLVYFEVPKAKKDVAIVGIGMHIGSSSLYFGY
jgi:hypothetical protein